MPAIFANVWVECFRAAISYEHDRPRVPVSCKELLTEVNNWQSGAPSLLVYSLAYYLLGPAPANAAAVFSAFA